jgi:hypothetical protein
VSRHLSCLALVVVALAGCVGAAASVPTHHLVGSGPAGLQSGALADQSGCVVLSARATRWLVVWPSGAARVGDRITVGGVEAAAIGDSVELGGGEYGRADYAWLRSNLLNGDVPAQCQADGYWLATSVTRKPGPAPS